MNGAFTASCIQFTSARDYEPNIRVVSDLVRRARDGGGAFNLDYAVSVLADASVFNRADGAAARAGSAPWLYGWRAPEPADLATGFGIPGELRPPSLSIEAVHE